jgi:hypothetical protein
MVMAWRYVTTAEVDDWVESLGQSERNEIAAMLDALTRLGPSLGRPVADTLNGSRYANMKKLRGKTPAAVLRLAFAFDPERVAQIFCGGNKKGVSEKRFYKQLIERADKLYKLHLEVSAAKKKGKPRQKGN